jgi:hypothetical protein
MTAAAQQRAPTKLGLAPELGVKPAHAGHGIPAAVTPVRSMPGAAPGLLRPSQVPVSRSQVVALQRACACGDGAPCSCPSEGAREQEEAASAQRTGPAVGGHASALALPSAPGPEVLAVLNDGGQALDPTTRAEMESRLGDDFSSVRVHTGSTAAGSAAAVQARAFTVGNEIVFGAGSFAPGTDEGRRTLAHELVHVQQQRRGPVSGTSVGGGIRLSDPADRFEREAERLASAALSRTPSHVGDPGARSARPVRPSSVPASATSARSAPASVARALVPVQRQDVPLDEDLPLPTGALAGGPGADGMGVGGDADAASASQEEIAAPPLRDENVALSAISEPARTVPVDAPVVQRWGVLPANPSLNTVVCDGTGGLRVQVGVIGNADETGCLSDCVRQHEQSHLADAVAAKPDICKSQAAGGVIGATPGGEQNATEFKASNVEIACLQGKQAAADAKCKPIITARITQMKAYRDRFK